MASKRMTYFWSDWPPASQERLFKFVLTGVAGLCFAVLVGLNLFTGALGQQIAAVKQEYGLVVPLVQEITTLRAQQGDLAGLVPEEAVRRIVEDRVLGDYVQSLRSSRIGENRDGVQVTFAGLTLIMLTDFLQDVRDRASLQAPEFTLTRNPDDPRLADVHMVLAR
ncbi:MAG: hypothetical protein AB7E51_14305 [Pseudodesulfovibrio sp.]|jgi:hypothetical protein|uniref:Uncharacterized protein n=1 Tax=Pseudodesulfovibrio indicus TaxID=1716143 RepID=A0A126QJ79_9BACT|nr:hypothetical protein [Pseudodesulfovibrio indicus]AMK10043.1 hypothetical protein AWY79_02390 [Pseudodesulfovibrio indicus]TDT86989.1 hypothetical protein EDC59_11070 [Pseudodesulfovibrio indicus]